MRNITSIGVAEDRVAPASASYVWKAPDRPLAVYLSLDVVDRMEREVIENFKAITERGSEIGGLLLGKLPANQPVVVVEDYRKVACDYARGPLYLLAEPDKVRLEAALAEFKEGAEKGLVVVGFFRSNTRKELALAEDDLALMRRYFAEARKVCLLVRPFSMKPSVGGFFIWEGGQMESRASYREFPFRRSELIKGEFAKAIVSGGESAAAAAPGKVDGSPVSAPRAEVRVSIPLVVPKREEPPAPKPEVRATVLPVIRKRETPPPPLSAPPRPAAKPEARIPIPAVIPKSEPSLPSPPAAEKPEVRLSAAPASPKPEVAPPPPAKRPAGSAVTSLGLVREPAPPPPMPETRKAAPAVEPKREEPAAPTPARPEAIPAPPPVAARCEEPARPAARRAEELAEAAPAPARRSRKLAVAVAAGAAVLMIATGGLLYLRPSGGRTPTPAVSPDASSLALRVERNAGQLQLSWNREANVLKRARAAVLSIFDGEQKEDVKLDPGQLRSGSIVYAPITNDVSFKLEVIDDKGQTQSESVRAIAGRPSPAAPLGQTPPAQSDSGTSDQRPAREPEAGQTPPPGPQTPADTSPTPGGGAEPTEPPRPAAQSAAQLRAESLAARLSPPSSLPEPPRLEGQSGAALVRPPETQSAVPPPPAQESGVARPEPAPAPVVETSAPSQPLRVGGNVQPAHVVRQVTPAYPPLARQARVSGVVRVEATIGKDGRVLRVQAISGPPLLRQAAQDAVRQWVYKPTTLNGQPVEVVTQVDVTFNLNR